MAEQAKIIHRDVERIIALNRRFDSLPREVRFHIVLWTVLLAGAVNLLITFSVRFPFGLLLLLVIAGIAALRVPYVLGWYGTGPADHPVKTVPIRITGVDWAIDLNHRYEARSELDRMWIVPAILVVSGLINMWLTLSARFPFGLLFLLTLLALVAIRAPYVAGWFVPSGATDVGAADVPAPAAELPAVAPSAPVLAAEPAVSPAEPVPAVPQASAPAAEPPVVEPAVVEPAVAEPLASEPPAAATAVAEPPVTAPPVAEPSDAAAPAKPVRKSSKQAAERSKKPRPPAARPPA